MTALAGAAAISLDTLAPAEAAALLQDAALVGGRRVAGFARSVSSQAEACPAVDSRAGVRHAILWVCCGRPVW